MRPLKTLLAATLLAFSASAASATIFTPIPGLNTPGGITVTPGLANSWLFTGADEPANQSPATIETFLETLLPAQGELTNEQSANCGAAGFDCSNGETVGSSTFAGNLFAVHIGNGELVFLYDTIIDNFSLTVPAGILAAITNGAEQGGGLSNIRVFTGNIDDGTNVPLPGAALLLMSGLGALGIAKRRKA
jgi:hypothetical protein